MKLIEFYATWCGPCKIQKPIVEKISKEFQIDVQYIDIDEDPGIANKYEIKAVPSIVILNDENKMIKKLVGLQTASVLKANLQV
jgi:thioredoxin 1